MICPFCAGTVDDAALVCRFCRHDLTYVKRLHGELQAQADRIAELEQALASLDRPVPDAETAGFNATIAPDARALPIVRHHASPWAGYAHGFIAFLVPFVLLVGTHYLFVFALDLHAFFLRAMLILLPAVWGAHYRWLRTAPLAALLAIALLLGFGSMLAMLTVTSRIDGVPILPQGRQDWVETLQVIVSVSLGFGCGVFVARTLAALRARSERMRAGYVSALSMVKSSSRDPEKMGAQADIAQKMIDFAVPILSGVGAIIAGMFSLLK